MPRSKNKTEKVKSYNSRSKYSKDKSETINSDKIIFINKTKSNYNLYWILLIIFILVLNNCKSETLQEYKKDCLVNQYWMKDSRLETNMAFMYFLNPKHSQSRNVYCNAYAKCKSNEDKSFSILQSKVKQSESLYGVSINDQLENCKVRFTMYGEYEYDSHDFNENPIGEGIPDLPYCTDKSNFNLLKGMVDEYDLGKYNTYDYNDIVNYAFDTNSVAKCFTKALQTWANWVEKNDGK